MCYGKDMSLPLIIQGGMGVGVSDWRLAKAVSTLGQLGVVSGTGINTILIRRLQDSDAEGHVRRALAHFPDGVLIEQVLSSFWLQNGRSLGKGYKRIPLPSVSAPLFLQQLSVVASFVEVFLAKEGHDGVIGINFLEKLQTSNLPGIYGAMLAGVDYVLMGAGVPREIPGVLDRFSEQNEASIKIVVAESNPDTDIRISFDPMHVFPKMARSSLIRPKFLAIISSATLALHLARKSTGKVDGFIIEGPLAGGHNAPPRGPLQLNERGEPIYSAKDEADLEAIRKIGLPFWLAGSFGSPDKLQQALSVGATGIQVGTAFAFCNESGLSEHLRKAVIEKWCFNNPTKPEAVFTDPFASPTGFPFKIAPLEGTLSESALYQARSRKCDLGYLRQIVNRPDGSMIYRCPAEPIDDYVHKGGKIEDTVGRKCLCNALMSNIGLGQIQKNGYQELPLLTAGDDLLQLKQFLPHGQQSYTAHHVISYLSGQTS